MKKDKGMINAIKKVRTKQYTEIESFLNYLRNKSSSFSIINYNKTILK